MASGAPAGRVTVEITVWLCPTERLTEAGEIVREVIDGTRLKTVTVPDP